MGNRGSSAPTPPATVVFAGPRMGGKSCLACALCQGGETGSFPGNEPNGAYYATNGMQECRIGRGTTEVRIIENGGGSEAGLRRMNIASCSDAWGCVCLCFVVDAAERDKEKIQQARGMLRELADSQPRKPIVVVAAKCDVENAMNSGEVFDSFNLQDFGKERLFKVISTSALKDRAQGLNELIEFFKTAMTAV